MTSELKGLGYGILAGLFVVGASFGVSAVVTHGQSAESTPALMSSGTGAVTAGQLVPAGRSLYSQMCSDCHGAQAQGQFGPTLHHLHDPDAKIARSIANGFPPRMPAYKNKLTSGQIQTLVAYIQTLE